MPWRTPLRVRSASLSAVAALLVAGGCNESPTGPMQAAAGIYVLDTVDGASLPTVIEIGTETLVEVEIVAGEILLRETGTCGSATVARQPGQQEVQTTTNTCTWQIFGDEVTLNWFGGVVDRGILQGNRLTLTIQDLGGRELIFER
jgi:hypothetical protein